jgi:HlyD family secretion protein
MKRRPVWIAAAVVLLAVVAALVIRSRRSDEGLVASGTVEATEAQLGFQVPGRILEIKPREGDRVHAGDVVAWLDRTELQARRAQARAQLAAARALLAELEAGARREELAVARESARAAEERYRDAERDYQRIRRLFEGGAVAREALDKAQLALDVAQSQRDQAQQQLQMVETGPRRERLQAQRAAVEQAEAGLRQAEAALQHAVITAPFDGVVTVRDREPGEVVGAGVPVLTLMNPDDRWVRIYIREDRIGAVSIGQPAAISTDTYPGKRYQGVVSFIASEAEFTPRNVQTAEERVKLVYAVKVRITGDSGQELKPGMPADVRLAAAKAREPNAPSR